VTIVRLFTSRTQASVGGIARRAAAVAGAGMLAASLAAISLQAQAQSAAGPTAPAMQNLPGSFADLSDRLSPAVVNISTAQTLESGPDIGEGSPLEDLFRDLYPEDGEPGPRRVQSLGSGFVIDPEGLVVTNNHVIEGADEISVTFPDGLTLDAEVVGFDGQTDLAVLKIQHDEPLPFVTFGDSDAARVGDWVLAIGNPFGFSGSVSAGIISARNRDIQAGRYDDFIQTDAAINRGNSGGPLFNMSGDVIGVNTAIISPTGGSIGIGFAVPSNLVEKIVAQLREFGETRRGWLGVRIQTVNEELADALGLDRPEGALVAEVTPGGPAEAAGIQAGDVIIEFDGKPVPEMRDLPRIVADTPIDETVPVTIVRDGERLTLDAKIGLLSEGEELSLPAPLPGEEPKGTELPDLGMTLTPLSQSARVDLGIAEGVDGVLVTEVAPDGQAAEKGIAAGDVIVEVGQQPVLTPAEVEEQITAAVDSGRKSVLFLVHSEGELRFVPLTVGGN
jgi:serine protease Do